MQRHLKQVPEEGAISAVKSIKEGEKEEPDAVEVSEMD